MKGKSDTLFFYLRCLICQLSRPAFAVLRVKWPLLYSACSYPEWIAFVLWNVWVSTKRAASWENHPGRVWHSDFKWNNTGSCLTVRSCSNKKSGHVFIYLRCWHFKAMLWADVFFSISSCLFLVCALLHCRITHHEKHTNTSFQKAG